MVETQRWKIFLHILLFLAAVVDMTWYNRIWYDIIGCNMIWYDMTWYNRIWYDIIGYNMIWHDMI